MDEPVAWRWKNSLGEWTYLDDDFCLKNRRAAGFQCFPLYENAQPIKAGARAIAAKLKKIITLPSDGSDADAIADAVAFLERSADAYRQAALDCAAAIQIIADKSRFSHGTPTALDRAVAACRAIAERGKV